MRLQLPRWSWRCTNLEAASDRRQMRCSGDADRIEADDISRPVPPDHLAERNEADQDQRLKAPLRRRTGTPAKPAFFARHALIWRGAGDRGYTLKTKPEPAPGFESPSPP